MSKSRNSKTQAEAIAEFDAQRVVDPNAGQDTEIPPAAEAAKRTRSVKPLTIRRLSSIESGGDMTSYWEEQGVTELGAASFSTELDAEKALTADTIEAGDYEIIQVRKRVRVVERIAKVVSEIE